MEIPPGLLAEKPFRSGPSPCHILGNHRLICLFVSAPGTRVMFLLKENDDTPALFTEMGELGLNEWRETARWVKFEEDVEQGEPSRSFRKAVCSTAGR